MHNRRRIDMQGSHMSDNGGFAKLVPGFEFLQNLAKGAGATMPGVGHWVAPTLDPDEIDKRIEELRTVKFWLEQNGRMLDTTIQALEVQRMTLTTLRTMNVQMGDLREAMMIRKPSASEPAAAAPEATTPAPDASTSPLAAAASAASAFSNAFQFPRTASTPSTEASPSPSTEPEAAPPVDAPPQEATTPPRPAQGAIDPMQWWGALTKQFTALATSALQDGAAAVAASTTTSPPATAPSGPSPASPKPSPRKAKAPATSPSTVKPLAGKPAKDSPLPRKKPVRKTPGR
jgi:hypothetical protein